MFKNFNTKLLGLVGMMMLWPLFGAAQVNLSNGLVLDLPFSGNANDTSTSFLTGKVVNAVLTTDRNGDPNSAYSFNGIDAYILIPHSEVFNFGNDDPFSISVWVKQTANQNDLDQVLNDVLSKWTNEVDPSVPGPTTNGYPFVLRCDNQSSTQHGRMFFQRWDGNVAAGGCETSSRITTFEGNSEQDSLFNDNEWHHYVFRKIDSSGFLNMWVDALDYGLQEDNSGSGGGGCGTKNGSPLMIGARRAGDNQFAGAVDDFKIWNRTLNEEEIQALYSGTTSAEGFLGATISLSPNPAPGAFTLHSPQAAIQSLTLYDLTGRHLPAEIVHDRHEAQVRSSYRGLAIVKVQTDQGMWVKKVRME